MKCLPKRGARESTLLIFIAPQSRSLAIYMFVPNAIHTEGRPVWAEISLKAIQGNLKVVGRQIGPKPKILVVVKSIAYGLGAVPVSRGLAKAGAEWLGVTCSH